MNAKQKRLLVFVLVGGALLLLFFLPKRSQASGTVVEQQAPPFNFNAPDLALPDVKIPLLQLAQREAAGYNPFNNPIFPAAPFAATGKEEKVGCCCSGAGEFTPYVPAALSEKFNLPRLQAHIYSAGPMFGGISSRSSAGF